MVLSELINILESANIKYRIEDETRREFNLDTLNWEMVKTGKMLLSVESSSSVYFWFELDLEGDWAFFRERWNAGIGKGQRTISTMFRFIDKVKAGKFKQ